LSSNTGFNIGKGIAAKSFGKSLASTARGGRKSGLGTGARYDTNEQVIKALGASCSLTSACQLAPSLFAPDGTLLFGNLNDPAPRTQVSPAVGRRLPLRSCL